MKKKFVLIFVISIIRLYGQKDDNIDFSKLSSPTIPAFTILGVQPSEISQPKTLDALETSVYSNFAKNGNFALPKNYALEFTPYWLKPKPQITFKDYVNPTPWQSFLQNSAFSLASFEQQSYADTAKKNIRMGFGYRTMIDWTKFTESNEYVEASLKLYRGIASIGILLGEVTVLLNDTSIKTEDDIKKAFDIYIANQKMGVPTKEQKEEIEHIYIQFIVKTIEANKGKSAKEILIAINKVFSEDAEKIIQSVALTEKISKLINDRYGFNLELAGALTLDFPTNDVNYSKIPKVGIWLTPSYKFKGKAKFELLGVVRYIKNILPGNYVQFITDSSKNYTTNWDLGAKLVFTSGKFSINGELVQRFQSVIISSQTVTNVNTTITTTTKQSTKDFKATLNLNYALSDKMVLTYSFGKNYELNTENVGNLISMLSLNYGFGKIKKEDFKQ